MSRILNALLVVVLVSAAATAIDISANDCRATVAVLHATRLQDAAASVLGFFSQPKEAAPDDQPLEIRTITITAPDAPLPLPPPPKETIVPEDDD